jgi:hypothetical protein
VSEHAAPMGLRVLLLPLLALGGSVGCPIRLSDPVYAFKDIRADEPTHEGNALIFGSVVVDSAMSGDLNTVTLQKIGPGQERSYRTIARVNMFRVFFRRAMKDGHFLMEVEPGIYEVDGFSTSGWGQPQVWNTRDSARKATRMVITRPGVYDLGTLHVKHAAADFRNYSIERIPDSTVERQAVLSRALAGTRWERLPPPSATAAMSMSE